MPDYLHTDPKRPDCAYNRGASCWWPDCAGAGSCYERPVRVDSTGTVTCPQVLGAVRTGLRRSERRARWHRTEQAAIFALSAAAIALVDLAADPLWRFAGNAIGLTAQPLWAFSTIRHRQWGMFALTLFYTGVWSAGFIRYWPL